MLLKNLAAPAAQPVTTNNHSTTPTDDAAQRAELSAKMKALRERIVAARSTLFGVKNMLTTANAELTCAVTRITKP